MASPQTIMAMRNPNLSPAKLQEAALVLVDIQCEYLEGPLTLTGVLPAIAVARDLLQAARQAGAPVIHIAHRGADGGFFDRKAKRGQIVTDVAPEANEPVVEKTFANAFAETDLESHLRATQRSNIVLAGFMTHNCISSTARGAVDLGFRPTILASACASRDLPDGKGGIISAEAIHQVALVELSDTIAIIAQDLKALL